MNLLLIILTYARRISASPLLLQARRETTAHFSAIGIITTACQRNKQHDHHHCD
jgi:hypothetical protein